MAPKNSIVEEIKEAQALFAQKQANCKEIEETLSRYENKTDEAHQLEVLQRRKEGIQADIAMGRGKQTDLDQINQEIAVVNSTVGEHSATVAGLRRRLEEANAELGSANYNKLKLEKSFIWNEANRIQAEYLETAKILLAQFRQLKALGNIYSEGEYNPEPFTIGNEHQFLSIPMFQLPASGQWPPSAATGWPKWDAAIEIADHLESYSAADKKAEKARLAERGVLI